MAHSNTGITVRTMPWQSFQHVTILQIYVENGNQKLSTYIYVRVNDFCFTGGV